MYTFIHTHTHALIYLYIHTHTQKDVPRAPGGDAPAVHLLGVRPHEVRHGSVVRHLLLSADGTDLVQCVDCRREAAVHAEHFIVDDGR